MASVGHQDGRHRIRHRQAESGSKQMPEEVLLVFLVVVVTTTTKKKCIYGRQCQYLQTVQALLAPIVEQFRLVWARMVHEALYTNTIAFHYKIM